MMSRRRKTVMEYYFVKMHFEERLKPYITKKHRITKKGVE